MEMGGGGGRNLQKVEKNPSLNKNGGGGLNHLETHTIGRRVIGLFHVVIGRHREPPGVFQ